MNLYNEIMNIRDDNSKHSFKYSYEAAYLCGFQDARHAAAELSLKVESRIEELESSLEWVLQGFKSVLAGKSVRDADEIICHVEKLLGNNK